MSVPERDRLAHRIADALNAAEPSWNVTPLRVWTTKDCRLIADAVLADGYNRTAAEELDAAPLNLPVVCTRCYGRGGPCYDEEELPAPLSGESDA